MMSKIEIEFYLPVLGVGDEHNAILLNSDLNAIKGVLNAHFEVNNHRVLIKISEAPILVDVIDKVIALGYEVPIIEQSFPVLQMNCASCAGSVESMMEAQLGVLEASVNYGTSSAKVKYVQKLVNPKVLQEAIREIGFDILLPSDEKDTDEDKLEQFQKQKYYKLKRNTIGSILLALPVMTIGMFLMDMPFANYIMWLLSTPVLFVLGRSFFVNAYKQAKHKRANMDTLVALSTGTAYLFSMYNMFFPSFWLERGLEPHVYFESAAVIIAFILLGKFLEEKAKQNTSTALKKLIGLQPKKVTRLNSNGETEWVNIDDIALKDILLVKPGEKFAVDGVVIEGSTYVDESMLTGEPIPVLKEKNSKVFAGTINQKGSVKYEAVKIGKTTMLAQIISLVEEAQGSKAPVQKLVDKIAGVFVPVVMGIALITFIIWLLFGGEHAFTHALMSMITVLVIACPCALGLATPTAIMVGVGKGTTHGILIKDAESLELSKHISAIVLDKTGTLTEGKPAVSDVFWLNRNEKQLSILSGMERMSEHPLADAVVKHFQSKDNLVFTEFQNHIGSGISAVHDEVKYYIGNEAFILANNIIIADEFNEVAQNWYASAKTVIWFADENKVLALLAVEDKLKSSAFAAVNKLQKKGIKVFMLTGDNKSTASAIAVQTGIENFKAEMMPEDKANFIKSLQNNGEVVAMVGDGINDSAALAQADVSIAMGKGSDIAMDVAKMTIISSDLTKISTAISLSKATVKTIKQNLFWAFIYNVIGIPLAAGVLYPLNGFLLNPMIAGAAMALSSVSVVTNSLRLKNAKIK